MNEATKVDTFNAILGQVQAKLDRAYSRALADNVEEPILLVLDIRDGNARAIAEQCLDAGLVEAMVAEARRLGKRPDLVIPLPRHRASDLLAKQSPSLGSDLAASNASEGYLVVLLAFGSGMVAEIRPAVPEMKAS